MTMKKANITTRTSSNAKKKSIYATTKDLLNFDIASFEIHKDIISIEKSKRNIAENIFWKQCADYAANSGCYIIAKKASQGMIPVYVGKATKGFRKEVFNSQNILKYIESFKDAKSFKIIVFFIIHPKRKGKINATFIDEIETYLIGLGINANAKMMNSKKVGTKYWAIKGVVRHGRGQLSKAAKDFRRCMSL